MLLNFSNHPSDLWSDNQRQVAIGQYGKIEDYSFPLIPPLATTSEVHQLAAKYELEILKKEPRAVHIMGEMTFTYALVNRLTAAGTPCIAATTHRVVQEKSGKKITDFHFVQFRRY